MRRAHIGLCEHRRRGCQSPRSRRAPGRQLHVSLTESLTHFTARQASFDFMKKHESKFRGKTLKQMRNAAAGLDPNAVTSTTAKVRNGNIGEWKLHLAQEMADAVDARWQKLFAPLTDAKSYEEMRQNTLRELGRSFGKSESA